LLWFGISVKVMGVKE